MRIRKVTVKGLFGIFNHEVPFNLENHITIIHGPNGVGKTILLTMLNALFNSHYHELRRIPYSELSIDFDDDSNLRVKKIIQPKVEGRNIDVEVFKLIIEFTKNSSKVSYTIPSINKHEIPFPLSAIEHEIPGLQRMGAENWIYMPTQEKLSLDEIMERFADKLPIDSSFIQKRKNEPLWLKEIRESIHIGFIQTQRLLNFSYTRRLREYNARPSMVPTVLNYSEELTNAIQSKLAEYGSLSQSLDRTFPSRLVKGRISSELTIDELKTKLNELEEKRSMLMEAGLLDKEKEIDFRDLPKIDETKRNILSVYIDDVQKKLQVFDELTNKIDLLVKIINNKEFLYKKMSISKKEGFIFKTPDEKQLIPTNLSSGEQHELVLLYELLFKVGPNSLILIDEPELSLHVGWQQQFLKDLQEITKLVEFDVLIATHSPLIINNRWDLTVELKGPENEDISKS